MGAPATSQKAAPDGSEGTVSAIAAGSRGPSRRTVCAPSGPVVSSTAMPRARSIRSVWSRVATDSVTAVSPSAARPASRTADLTWALGTGVSWPIGESGARPVIASGSSVPPPRPANTRPSGPAAR